MAFMLAVSLQEAAVGFDIGALSSSLRRQTEVRVAEVNKAAGGAR